MSMTPPSRASLADVIVLISQANLSGRQKGELRSAVRTVARLLDGEPANIAADPAGLRRCLEMIAPEAHGISRGRWANLRSLLRKALGLVPPMLPGRSVQPILDDCRPRKLSGGHFQRPLAEGPGKILGSTGLGLELVPTRGRPLASSCHRAPVETCDLRSALVGI